MIHPSLVVQHHYFQGYWSFKFLDQKWNLFFRESWLMNSKKMTLSCSYQHCMEVDKPMVNALVCYYFQKGEFELWSFVKITFKTSGCYKNEWVRKKTKHTHIYDIKIHFYFLRKHIKSLVPQSLGKGLLFDESNAKSTRSKCGALEF